MSLIYDALRQSNSLPAQSSHHAAHAARPIAHASSHRSPLIWASAVVVGGLAAGLFYAVSPAPAPAAPLPAAPVATAPVPAERTAAAPRVAATPVHIQSGAAPVSLARDSSAAGTPAAPPTPPPTTIPVTQPAPLLALTAPVTATKADTVVEVQAQQLSITVSRRDSSNAAPAAAAPVMPSGTQIPTLIKSLEAAVALGDAPAIDAGLAMLRSQLPGDSLTLLRTEAWVAHTRGELVAAEESYRQILARIANDEQAGVNLALLEAGRGESDAAQTRLQRLAAKNGNSALISRALAQLQGNRQ